MKNWKKLLACLLVGLMALTVFTACDASVGAPMGAKRSNAESESVKKLCESFKGVTYDEELSEKAYYIAYWVAGTSVSCSTNANKTELYRVGSANDSAKINLLQHNYATAFDSMGIGKGIGGGMGADDFIPGFYIDTDLDSRKDYISFTLPKVGSVAMARLCSEEADAMARSMVSSVWCSSLRTSGKKRRPSSDSTTRATDSISTRSSWLIWSTARTKMPPGRSITLASALAAITP